MTVRRADEDLHALEAHGIEIEIVPGVTTAFAAAAATQLPLTKRGIARSIAFFTSATAPNQPDQLTLPDCDTLIQYMGGREAMVTAQKLLEQGRSPDLPVVIVENCSLPNQKIVRMNLRELERGLQDRQGPVLVMIGAALAARDSAE